MADKSKSEKLAAAKKRLKQFQSQQQSDQSANSSEPAASHEGSVSDQLSDASANNGSEPEPDVIPTAVPELYPTKAPAVFQATVPEVSRSVFSEAPAMATSPAITSLFDLLSAQIQKPSETKSRPVETVDPIKSHHQPSPTNPSLDLDVERQRNHELSVQLLNQNTQIEQLRGQVQRLNHENSNKVTLEIGPLQQQLQSHVQTIGVLVGEKAELSSGLAKFQSLARQKITEVEELQGRLNASRHRVQVLERDIGTAKHSSDRIEETQQKLCSELESGQEQLKQKQRQLDEVTEECAELRRKLALRTSETDKLNAELTDTKDQLHLVQLRVEQLTAGDGVHQDDSKIEQLAQQKIAFERQVGELQLTVEQVAAERDQANQQYQNYVQTLNKEIANLAQQLQSYVADNERLSEREQSLVRHVGELERQMQQQLAKQKNLQQTQREVNRPQEVQDNPVWMESVRLLEQDKVQLNDHLQAKLAENDTLQKQIQESHAQIEHLETALERLKVEQPDAKSLIVSMESDKVAASRAVSQNVELKQQLEEIQRAFVQLSNDKLELTDRLQSEQHLGRENKNSVGALQEEITTVREKLHFKDEEMIRLSHENEERHKEVMQLTIEIDRLRHYESKEQSSSVVQQQSNELIRKLRNKISQLEQAAPVSNSTVPLDSSVAEIVPTDDQPPATNGTVEDVSDVASTTSTITSIATEEAMERLQERFKRTMSDHANLTEEKIRLEHLVTQLQDETDTIGEYIALYHKQRQLLKQREVEKDVQLKQIVCDREEMRQKLAQLNGLVEQLMRQQNVPFDSTLNNGLIHSPQLNGNADTESQHHSEHSLPEDNHTSNTVPLLHDSKPRTAETATKILTLLSEIQDKNQTLDNRPLPALQKCGCCYGKLEVV